MAYIKTHLKTGNGFCATACGNSNVGMAADYAEFVKLPHGEVCSRCAASKHAKSFAKKVATQAQQTAPKVEQPKADPTYGDIAADYSLWQQYVGDKFPMTEQEFNAGTAQSRLTWLAFRGGV